VLLEDSAQFASQKNRFPANRLDDVSYRPDAQLSKALAVRTTCHTVRMHIRLKHHPFGRRRFPSGPPLCQEASNCSSLHPSGRFHSPSGRLSVFDQASGFLSKHKYVKIAATVRTTWIPVRTRSSIRQVLQFKSSFPDASHHGPAARKSNMEIACIRSLVWTTILLVRTREASIWKLLAADVRSSKRQGNTIRTRPSNRNDFQ
jgi:hypothetical protein